MAQQTIKIYIEECGPITVRGQGQATFGDLVRYTRKKHKIYPEEIALLWAKIAERSPITGRHIYRMEQNDSFFPHDSNRRWVLATLLRMPPELIAYLSLQPIVAEQDGLLEKPLFPISTKPIDTDEYYKTLQKYWINGRYTKGTEYAINDVKRRIYFLKDKVLFEFSPEKPLMTRLLCGYKILLAKIAEEHQFYTEAEQHLTDAFILAGERECYDLQAIALKQLMVLSTDNGDVEAALGNFERARQLGRPRAMAPQIWGHMLTLASLSKAHIAKEEDDRVAALKCLDEAKGLAQPINLEHFLFLATFDKQRYFLDCAQACVESPIKKWRSPKKAEEYLKEAAKEGKQKGKTVNAYRQAFNDLIWARIYCDQEAYTIATTTAERALVTLKGLQSKIHLNTVSVLLAEIKERVPLGIEIMSLEAELMKAQQPYLFA